MTLYTFLTQVIAMYDPDHDPDDPDPIDDDIDPAIENYDPIDAMDPIHPARHVYNAERSRKKRLLIIRRRRIRDFSDPFDVTLRTFVKSYRLSQDLVFSLIRLIRPHIRQTTSTLALPLETKVSCF